MKGEKIVNKYYWGYSERKECWEMFSADVPGDATPESTGYSKVVGPYDTEEEAKEADPNR